MAEQKQSIEQSSISSELFQIGQRIQAYRDETSQWNDAIVKDISPEGASVKVGFLKAEYSAEQFDKWIVKVDWNQKIRDPYTETPFHANAAYNRKNIDEWTCSELQQWINTLSLNNSDKENIISAITEQEITGADINSIEEVGEIMDSFEVNESAAAEILSTIQNIRIQSTNISDNPNNNNNNVINVVDTLFYEGQRIEVKKKRQNQWRAAIVKQVEMDRIKVGWLQSTLQDEQFDTWINCDDYDTMIRQPNSDNSEIEPDSNDDLIINELENKVDELERDNSKCKRMLFNKEEQYNVLDEKYQRLKQEHIVLQNKNKTAESIYNSMVRQFTKLKHQNEALQLETKNVYHAVKKQSGEQNELLQKENGGLKDTIHKLENEVSVLKLQVGDLSQENEKLTHENTDMNEECKELKLELKDVKQKHSKLMREKSLGSDYKTWDYNAITDWIIGLDEDFIEYEKVLRKTLKEEQLTGADLIYLDKNDLNRFGIKIFKHKQRVMQEIQTLTSQAQNNDMQNNIPGSMPNNVPNNFNNNNNNNIIIQNNNIPNNNMVNNNMQNDNNIIAYAAEGTNDTGYIQ